MPNNKRPLLTTQFFTLLGQSAVGIFFPFFVQRNFGLETWEIIVWFGLVHLLMGLLVYPINYYGVNKVGSRRMIQLGLIFNTIFYMIIALEMNNLGAFALANACYIAFLVCFWPNFNYLNTYASRDGLRGQHMANLQIVTVGSNLVAPIITGLLLEVNQAYWSLIFSMVCFTIGLYWVMKIKPRHAKLKPLHENRNLIRATILHPKRFWGFFSDGFMGIVMWIVWPFYLQVVVGKFSIMGILTATMAAVEVVISHIVGKLSDQKSAKDMLVWGVWARFFDVALRATYLFFSQLWFVVVIQFLGTILGPRFQIPAQTRLYEISEEQPEQMLEYFMVREMFLGFMRPVVLMPIATLVYFTSEIYLGIVFLLAALSVFGFKRL